MECGLPPREEMVIKKGEGEGQGEGHEYRRNKQKRKKIFALFILLCMIPLSNHGYKGNKKTAALACERRWGLCRCVQKAKEV